MGYTRKPWDAREPYYGRLWQYQLLANEIRLREEHLNQDIYDAVKAGYTRAQIAELLGWSAKSAVTNRYNKQARIESLIDAIYPDEPRTHIVEVLGTTIEITEAEQ